MRAAVLNDNNIVTNIIEVNSLSDFPECVDATGGSIGDTWDGAGFYTSEETLLEREDQKYRAMANFGVLETDLWSIPADGMTYATVTFGSEEIVYFSVNGEVHIIEPEHYIASLEITADAAGTLRVEVQDKQLIIVVTGV